MTDRKLWEAHIAKLHSTGEVMAKATRAGFSPTKYRNRVTEVDGIRFASQLEADRYKELKLLKASGKVAWFIRQVPFDVSPGVVYRADFLVIWRTEDVETARKALTWVSVEDCKGMMTPATRVKIAVVEERYGIHIRILRRWEVTKF